MHTKRTIRAIAVFVGVLALCAGILSSALASGSPARANDACASVDEVTSYRLAISSIQTEGGRSVESITTGEYRRAAGEIRRHSLTIATDRAGYNEVTEVVQVAGKEYSRRDEAESWGVRDLSPVTIQARAHLPGTFCGYFVSGLERIEDMQIDGVAATHFRAVIDAGAMSDQILWPGYGAADAEERSFWEESRQQFLAGEQQAEFWVAKDSGYLMRMTMAGSFPEVGSLRAYSFTMVLTMTDHNSSITIEAPTIA